MQRKTIFFLLLPLVQFAQIGGQSIYKFLNLPISARQAALGGKTVTNADYDPNQAFFNPATINEEMNKHLSVNYSSLYGEVSYGTIAYAHKINDKYKTVHAGVNYVNYGDFDGYDEFGNSSGSFSGSETALSLGYAYNIPNTSLYTGANLKFIYSSLEQYNSFGIASDIGLLYVNQNNNTNFGLTLRNLGYQIKPYDSQREDLPFEISAGVSQLLKNVPVRWHFTLDNLQQWEITFSNPNRGQTSLDGSFEPEKTTFIGNLARHMIFGVELLPEKPFNLRLGYNFRRAEELSITEKRSFAGISIGASIRFNRIRFDFTHSRYTVAANTSLFGLTINFGEK